MILFSPLTPLEDALRHVLEWLHTSIGLPWAWAIVGVTVIVRMILVPLTVRQIHSMQRLQAHMPEMKAIQQKYKADKQKQNEELMKFYKENNINPASSCLPMVAQIPVFFALYLVLRKFARHPPCADHVASYCVKHGDFAWLHFIPNIASPATAHWGGFVLLVVYVASQMASTLYMSATIDKTQRLIFMFMPIVFVFFIAHFPTGLVLYWMTTNLWTVGQGLITRRLVPRTPAPALGSMRRTSRTPAKAEAPAVAPEPERPQKPAQPRRVKRKKQGRARR